MITRENLLNGKECPPELEDNLSDFLKKINLLEQACGMKFKFTSFLRDKKDQIRIYEEKGITDESKIPMSSKHFFCQAVDIFDPKGELKKWILSNIKKVEEIGFWMEDFSSTKTWVHVQSIPPKSGNRFFIPY